MKQRDSIYINRLTLDARVGIYAAEKKKPQKINIMFRAYFRRDATKSIKDVLSYETAVIDIRRIVAKKHYDLLESLTDAISDHFFKNKRVTRVEVSIDKPGLPKLAPETFSNTEGVGFSSVKER